MSRDAEDLLAPLRAALKYAGRGGLAALKGLEPLVARGLERARAEGGPVAALERAARLVQGFDGLNVAEKRARLAELARVLDARPQAPPPSAPLTAGPLAADPLTTPLASFATPRGPFASELKKRSLDTVGALLRYLPRAHEDRSQPVTLASWQPETIGFAEVTLDFAAEVPTSGRPLFRISISDATGRAEVVFFNFRPWMRSAYPPGMKAIVAGTLKTYGARREIVHPEIASLPQRDRASWHRIVPIYPAFERHQRALRALVFETLERFAGTIPDPLPDALRERLNLMPIGEALREAHFPAMPTSPPRALDRLVFEEFLALQLGVGMSRARLKREPGIAFRAEPADVAQALARLPFPPTRAQRRALDEIAADMREPQPMNRLLQGDVGSGKTAVMAAAISLALDNGFQAAVMAPTEILAKQHFETLSRWFPPAGNESKVALVVGGRTAPKTSVLVKVASGTTRVVVGTHALIQTHVDFARLGLVCIDEQHRFGVLQRGALMEKGARPDVLLLTATPIPRTLQMSLFGDLDVSTLDELPPGRSPVATRVVPSEARETVYTMLDALLAARGRAYVVFPLVEETEKSDLASAEEGARALAGRFPRYRVGLLHGRMKADRKAEIMEAFRKGELQLLVSTTVIEVGVDVPEATAIVVESAERLGLSQLHQLRGRVGRGDFPGTCTLVTSARVGPVARRRLELLERCTDGFRIAEEDLAIRGPGEFLGTRQAGALAFGVADLVRDASILALARDEAQRLLALDPELTRPEHERLRELVHEAWGERLKLARVS